MRPGNTQLPASAVNPPGAAPVREPGPGTGPGPEPEDVNSLARDRFVAAFLEQSPRSHLRLVPISAFLAWLWSQGAGSLWPALWMAAVVLATYWRWHHTATLVHSAPPTQRPTRVAQVLFATGLLYAVPLVGFGSLGDFGRAALTLVLLVVATLSVVTTSGFRNIFMAFTLPMAVPLALAWAWWAWVDHNWAAAALALCIGLFLTFLNGVGKHAHAVFMEGCAFRFGEQQLNAELKTALAVADEANRAKTRFLAAASHDLRQPMHSVSVLVAALSLRPLDAATKEIVTLLGSVNQVLSRQLDTLLDMSKLDAGVVRADLQTQRLDLILKDHHAALAPVAAQQGLRTELQLCGPVWVDTDAALLTRAISNLTDNALKYTPAGGCIRLQLSAQATAGQALLEITDSGIGIAAAEQERVFLEFYQVDNIERDRRKGLGLGLSIVRRLCKLLGVDVALRSSPGHGTTVTLRFALAAAEAPAPVDLPPLLERRALQVLVVDDEATVRESMRFLLQGLGCTVTLAEGAADATQAAQACSFDLVLSDLRLRGGDSGLAVIDAVRALQPGVPAVLVTGDTSPEQLRELQALGLRLLFKPVALDQLLAVLPAGAAPAPV